MLKLNRVVFRTRRGMRIPRYAARNFHNIRAKPSKSVLCCRLYADCPRPRLYVPRNRYTILLPPSEARHERYTAFQYFRAGSLSFQLAESDGHLDGGEADADRHIDARPLFG